MEKVDAIAAAIDEQSRAGADIADHVRNIMSMAEANSDATGKSAPARRHSWSIWRPT